MVTCHKVYIVLMFEMDVESKPLKCGGRRRQPLQIITAVPLAPFVHTYDMSWSVSAGLTAAVEAANMLALPNAVVAATVV